MLLEKAYAKATWNYSNTIGGYIHEAFRNLTGAPSYVILHKDLTIEDLWYRIKEADVCMYNMAGYVHK